MIPPIIINESSAVDIPGDVDIFVSAQAAEEYCEPWYVDEPHFIFDGEGLQLKLSITGERLKLVPLEGRPRDPENVRRYLVAFLRSIADAKGWEFVGVTSEWCETASLKELRQKSLSFPTA